MGSARKTIIDHKFSLPLSCSIGFTQKPDHWEMCDDFWHLNTDIFTVLLKFGGKVIRKVFTLGVGYLSMELDQLNSQLTVIV